ncbi:MAG TPA: hypothetical protein VFU31_26825, partial [Candidatus Binatia bacterium]|nr:hypothetical protein [Candidatus Binatia bacterium]
KFKAAVVVTTIGNGSFLDAYVKNFTSSGTLGGVRIIVIPDLKTPTVLFHKCELLRRAGVDIVCPTIEDQNSYLVKLGIADLIAVNSDHRRNVGFLMALDGDADYVISIDDDNLCSEREDFIWEHSVVCKGEDEFEIVRSSNGWFNICDLIETEPQNVFPRGFPFKFRDRSVQTDCRRERARVHLNAGLWLQDPDLDAVTWLANPARVVAFRGRSVVLGENTWSPVNTQNTAVHRDAVIAFYFVRMGFALSGIRMDRWGDIFSGYFCQACVRHLGNRVRVGTPLVHHVRNYHDYMKDLISELPCLSLMEDFIESIRGFRLQGSTYADVYLSLAQQLDDYAETVKPFNGDDATRLFFHGLANDMRLWSRAVKSIIG